jgi:hypothetical protein
VYAVGVGGAPAISAEREDFEMTPKAKTVDSRARGAGNWRAFMGRPLWVLSAAAGLGLVLGMTTWAGTALASGPGTPATGTLQTQISALQRRLSQDESAIGGLRSLLRGVTVSRNGATLVIAGHGSDPRSALKTVMFKGVNVQVVNGTGIETRLNGLGNLIIGYADNTGGGRRTGSHNLITGDNGSWTSYGGLLAGDFNQIHGPFDAIPGGRSSTASGFDSTVAGGAGNLASGFAASANGGISNISNGFYATTSGGSSNTARGEASSVSGGRNNTAFGNSASVSGGLNNAARGSNDSILGGANEVIGTAIHCGFFPVSPSTSHC